MAAIIMIPNHIPALKIPPTTSQEDSDIATAIAKSHNEFCFILSVLAKRCKSFAAFYNTLSIRMQDAEVTVQLY
jgi:hypothetical protein